MCASSLRSPSRIVSRCRSMGAWPFSWNLSLTNSKISADFSSEMTDSGRFWSRRLVTDMTCWGPVEAGK